MLIYVSQQTQHGLSRDELVTIRESGAEWTTYWMDHVLNGPRTEWTTYWMDHVLNGPRTEWTIEIKKIFKGSFSTFLKTFGCSFSSSSSALKFQHMTKSAEIIIDSIFHWKKKKILRFLQFIVILKTSPEMCLLFLLFLLYSVVQVLYHF